MDDFFSANTALGLVLGLVLGIIGNYLFEGLGFKQRAAKLSKRRATKRLSELESRLAAVKSYQSESLQFLIYLSGRLVLINALWIAQSAFDYCIGLIGNATYGLSLFGRSLALPVRQEVVNTTIYAFGSLAGAVILIGIFNIAYRTYATWRMVRNFDAYHAKTIAEIAELRLVMDS